MQQSPPGMEETPPGTEIKPQTEDSAAPPPAF
jgi:hypothetical protein